MRTRRNLANLAFIILFLVACSPAAEDSGTAEPVCESGFCGEILTTRILSEGIGEIAVLVAYPQAARFPDGAGVVVIVPPIFNDSGGFTTQPDLTSIGLIQVTFLYPGMVDKQYDVSSEGEFDYGGDVSIQALRDVLKFAAGRLSNVDGRSLITLVPVKPLVDEVGIYAYDNAGIAAVNVLAAYGDVLNGIEYIVGHENPTVDTLLCKEAGYYTETGIAIQNPFYLYPSGYSPEKITLFFGTLRWDAEYTDESSSYPGRPYLDLDGDALLSDGDHLFEAQVPVVDGKRYYSLALTQALLGNQALTTDAWPDSLATPEEASAFWASRQSPARYQDFILRSPDLKVMLLFARTDHSQPAVDKPHIHQAFQGFRFEALLRWVRLNPDRAYLQQATGTKRLDFPDNPANTQPENWLDISDWAYAGGDQVDELTPLAALAEMSDRAHTARWDENLGTVLYEYAQPTPQP